MEKTNTTRKTKKSIFQRIASFFLAFIVAVMCIPTSSLNANAFWGWGWGWGGGFSSPNVLTNASVKFKDTDNNTISSIESGEAFKLVITISGNNVFQFMGGNTTTYTVEITDNNLLLPNFKNNGFYNGAKYNGYTLNYDEATGKRTITFSVKNGSTKTIQLSAKFANGTTEGDDPVTVKLVNKSTGASLSSTITPKASLQWGLDKTENISEISSADFDKGSIKYGLTAAPAYTSDGTGELWVTGLKFTDTLELSEGLKFKSEADLLAALNIPGASDLKITSFSDTKATITWTAESTNMSGDKPFAEMSAYKTEAELKLSCLSITSDSFE